MSEAQGGMKSHAPGREPGSGRDAGYQDATIHPDDSTARPNTQLLIAALAYAAAGCRIVPLHHIENGHCTCRKGGSCDSAGKHPTLNDWPKRATTDASIIRLWWRRDPRANIGGVLGPGSWVVLDVDMHSEDVNGRESLRDLVAEHGPLPETAQALTPRAGDHFFFLHPGGELPDVTKLAPGLELLGDGHNVALAPSCTERGAYIWEAAHDWEDVAPAPLPAWLLSLVIARPGDRGDGREPRAPVDLLTELPKAIEALKRLKPERCDTYADWLAVGMALTELGDAGLALWDGWSQGTPKYQPGVCAAKWPTFDLGQGITLASLYHWAAEDNPAIEGAAADKPRINAGEGDLAVLSDAAWEAIRADNEPPWLFYHGGAPVRVEIDPPGGARLRELTPERLRYELTLAATWYRRKQIGGEWKELPAAPTRDTTANMLAYPDDRIPLPLLQRIVRAPCFAPDGSLQVTPGYHPAGQVLVCLEAGLRIPDVARAPTTQDGEHAKALVGELIGEFPFVADADRTHAVAMMLGPFVRDLIGGPTPLHLVEAPAPGTGKGLLSNCVLMAGVGGDVGAMTYGRNEDETRKRIVSRLREGKPAILIDNVTLTIDSAALSSALTEPMVSDRLLGTNEMLNLPVRCTWAATANNPQLSTEIARRCIRIRLDAKTDRPWQRDAATFRHPALYEWARLHRGELIWAALTLVQSWLAAGRPPARVRPLGSYESWSRVVGGILAYAGLPGFLDNLDELYEAADGEGAVWRRFVQAWWEDHRGNPVGVAVLYPLAETMEDFDLGKGEQRAQKTALGMGLKRRRDMVIGGYRIKSAGTEHRLAQWQLVPTRPERAT